MQQGIINEEESSYKLLSAKKELIMKIINLIEDTQGHYDCIYEHGLCFYIETEKHKMLCDTGATDAFITNAEKLGVDLREVDTVILSHGHYDHTGGVIPFSNVNNKAKIYMQKTADGNFYNVYGDKHKYIGIDKGILELPQLRLIDGGYTIDAEVSMFSNITGRKYFAKSNLHLKKKIGEQFFQDDFIHEQCVVIKCDGKNILISGCAHNGILNILDRYREIHNDVPDIVISGFHMVKKGEYEESERQIIKATAEELKKYDTIFYSGHCTGAEVFNIMKVIMGNQLREIHCGETII